MSIALTHLANLISSLPMALDGEAESANSTGLGVISVVSIGITYVVLFALWFFVFRDRSGSKRKKD
jgi:branched-subunit amino acid ABC-type transport system permease component